MIKSSSNLYLYLLFLNYYSDANLLGMKKFSIFETFWFLFFNQY